MISSDGNRFTNEGGKLVSRGQGGQINYVDKFVRDLFLRMAHGVIIPYTFTVNM